MSRPFVLHVLTTITVLAAATAGAAQVKVWDQDGVPAPAPVQTIAQVGAYIFPGWYRDVGKGDYPYKTHDEDSEWKNAIAKVPKPRALLGFYDDSMPEVNDWHIKWALEHGVTFFAFDWYWNAGEHRLMRTLEDGFLKAKYAPLMKFCIHWCNHALDWKAAPGGRLDFSPKALVDMTQYMADKYFTLPNYLTVDNRPVFIIYEIGPVIQQNGGPAGFKTALADMNAVLRAKGLNDLYIVYLDRFDSDDVRSSGVSAMTSYLYTGAVTESKYGWRGGHSVPYEEMAPLYEETWQGRIDSQPPPFLLPIGSSWDNRPRAGDKAAIYTGRTPDKYRPMCQNSLKYIDKRINMAIIEAWNEWGEGSFIEPDKDFGFGYLDVVRQTFAPSAQAEHVDYVPTEQKIRSYSVLNDAELAAAIEIEKRPYPDLPVGLKLITCVIDPPAPETKPLKAWEFDSGLEGWHVYQFDAPTVKDGVLSATVTGTDPQLIVDNAMVDLQGVASVVLRVRVAKGAGSGQVFWATTDAPKMSENRSTHFRVGKDGEWHTYRIEKVADDVEAWTGTLTSLRFDLGRPGDRIDIDWVRLYPK